MGWRTLLLSLLTMVAMTATASAAVAAAPVARPRAVVEAASATWIVVHDTRSTSPISKGARGGAFEATSATGGGCPLTPNQLPPWTPGTPISVVGDTYVQPTPTPGNFSMLVHAQQGCDAFTDRTPGLPHGETLLTAAPDGYLTVTDDGKNTQHLTRYHTPNEVTAFAAPFSDSTTWTAVSSDTGIIAYSSNTKMASTSSVVRYMPWTQPGSWRTLLTSAPRTTLTCTPPSATHVTCTAGKNGPALIALTGHARTWLYTTHPKACRQIHYATIGTTMVALETSDAGVCTAGKLYQLSSKGALTGGSTQRLYSVPAGIQAGLGGILVSTVDQHHVMRLKNLSERGTIAWPAQGY